MANNNGGKTEKEKLERAIKIYKETAEKFSKKEKEIEKISVEVFESLTKNYKYFDADGSHKPGNWWKPLPVSTDHVLLDLRDFVFRCHLFENGIRWMIDKMREADILLVKGADLDEIVGFAVDYEAMAIHHELMGYVASKKSNPIISLADATRRYNLTHPPRLRDSRGIPMAQLGMWKCEADTTGHTISLGLPARVFHEKVFAPIKRSFDPSRGTFDPKAARGYQNGSGAASKSS